MARTLSRLITSAALSTCLAGVASAGCPVTGEEIDMMTAGGEAPCLAATPAPSISSAGGAATPSGAARSARSTPTNFQFTTFGNFTTALTSLFNGAEIDFPTLFPGGTAAGISPAGGATTAPSQSDLLLHHMPVISASLNPATGGGNAPDNSAAPLMGIGRIGPPFLHDAALNPGQITSPNVTTGGGVVPLTGPENGLAVRAPFFHAGNAAEILQFAVGGLQGELSFASTSALPAAPTAPLPNLEVHLSPSPSAR